ncbi:MAG: glutamate--tRNA ligase, partial [Acidimicrobiales bacterium]
VRQSARAERYRQAVADLLRAGSAYYCDCTRADVEARASERGTPGYDGHCRDRRVPPGPAAAVRFRVPAHGATAFDDVVRGEVSFDHANLEDFVIQRADGTATIFLPNAVDDVDMGITHVIRGEDLINVTPKVLLVREALGHTERPIFAHLPMLVNERRQKLSKRRDDVAVEEFRERGYLAEAMRNYLAVLGWGPADGVEIRPIEEIVALFRLDHVVRSPAFFDLRKLDHFNAEYIRRLDGAAFVEQARPWLTRGTPWPPPAFDPAAFERLAPLVQERVTTLGEVPRWVDFVFLDEPDTDAAAWVRVAAAPFAAALLAAAAEAYAGAPEWEAAALHALTAAVGEGLGLKLKKAQEPIRVAVTGRTVGPPLFESLEVLGRDRTLARLHR